MRRILLLVLLVGMAAGLNANAEVIHIPVGQQAPEKKDLPRPNRGMSAETVLEQYGLPESKSGPVGDPPISHWRYPDFTVYFESETVIHSVLTHTPKVDLSRIPAE